MSTPTGRVALTWGGATLLFLASALPEAGAAVHRDVWLADLADAYRSGERARPMAAIAASSQQDVEEAVKQAVEQLTTLASKYPSALYSHLAAITLLTDCAVHENYGYNFTRARWLLAGADRLMEALPDQRRGSDFGRRFYLLAGLTLHSGGDLEPAHAVLERGLRVAPRDPQLLTALGATLETVAALRRYARSPDSPGGPSRPGGYGSETGIDGFLPDATLRASEERYSQALAIAPDTGEARLRRGRVRLLQGHAVKALEDLDRIAVESRDARLRYLAHLFAGRAHEAEGNLANAVAAFQSAHDEEPMAQTALIALAHVRDRMGDPAGRQEALARATAMGDPGDPWWDYQAGDPSRILELLAQLQSLLP